MRRTLTRETENIILRNEKEKGFIPRSRHKTYSSYTWKYWNITPNILDNITGLKSYRKSEIIISGVFGLG